MPQIPGATKPLSTLVLSYLNNGKVTPQAQSVIDTDLPKPFHLTKERMTSGVNVIKEYMGQGKGAAPTAITSSDEGAMLAKTMVRAKL